MSIFGAVLLAAVIDGCLLTGFLVAGVSRYTNAAQTANVYECSQNSHQLISIINCLY